MAQVVDDKYKIIGCEHLNNEQINRPSMTYWQDAWRRLRKNKVAIGAFILLVIIGIMTLIGPIISGYDYREIVAQMKNRPPSREHWFGTDNLGRDLFSRVWQGGRISIIIGLIGAFIDVTFGTIYGGIAGYFGGKVDMIMMRIVEILGCIPEMVIIIIISMILPGNVESLIIAITITGWMGTARMVRGQVLQVKELEFVSAAKALGATPTRIIVKHIIPNVMSVLIVGLTMEVPGLIFTEAFLSFIGLGVKPPSTSWGVLTSEARGTLFFYPYQLFFPALFISLTMLCFNLLGDGLRDALDPKLRQ